MKRSSVAGVVLVVIVTAAITTAATLNLYPRTEPSASPSLAAAVPTIPAGPAAATAQACVPVWDTTSSTATTSDTFGGGGGFRQDLVVAGGLDLSSCRGALNVDPREFELILATGHKCVDTDETKLAIASYGAETLPPVAHVGQGNQTYWPTILVFDGPFLPDATFTVAWVGEACTP